MEHGGPSDKNRHAGDLGNVIPDGDGVVTIDLVDLQIPLDGPNSIIGRSVVVSVMHDSRDGTPKLFVVVIEDITCPHPAILECCIHQKNVHLAHERPNATVEL